MKKDAKLDSFAKVMISYLLIALNSAGSLPILKTQFKQFFYF